MLKGFILKNGCKITIEERSTNEILDEEQCAIFINEDNKSILLWKGRQCEREDRLLATKMAVTLVKTEYGGVGKVIHDKEAIEESVSSATLVDLPKKKL